MTDDAKRENEACEAVVREFEAFLRQHDAPSDPYVEAVVSHTRPPED